MTKTSTDLHWNVRAAKEVDNAKVNIADAYQRQLENDFILQHLPTGGQVLEVGCGNGYLTQELRKHVSHVDAFDYAENMIERAIRVYGETNNRFFHDNILRPAKVVGPYDGIVCVRVLINLRNLEQQLTAIRNMAGLLKPGGILLLVEGYSDGFHALDRIRGSTGLPPLKPAAINYYSSLDDVMPTLERFFEIGDGFHTGMFDFLTRVIYPVLSGADNIPEFENFHGKIIQVARAFNPDAMEKFGRVRGFALRKRKGEIAR